MTVTSKTARLLAAGVLATSLGASLVPTLATAASAATPAAVSVPRAFAAGSVIDVNSSNLQQVKAMAQQQPVVFLVTAPSWCGACQALDPVIHQLNAQDGGKWVLAVIDTDKSGGAEREFGVNALPTMIPYGKSGEMRSPSRMIGFNGQSATRSWLNQVMSSYGPVNPGPAPQPTYTPAPQPTYTPAPQPTYTPAPQPTNTPAPAPTNPIIQVNTSNLQQVKAMAQTRPVVFLVTAPSWCGACQQLDPVIKGIAQQDQGKWILAIIDVDRAGGAEREFRVSGYPTMIPYGKSGEMTSVQRMVGFYGQSGTRSWIDKVVQAYGPVNPGPAPVPTTTPAPQPTYTPAPVPTTTAPVPVPTTTNPGPVPTTTNPGPVPTTTNPGPVPTTTPAPAPTDGKLPPLPEGAVQLTDANFDQAVIQESAKRVVIIDISKDLCGPCIDLAPIMDEKYRADAGKWQYTRLDGTAYPALWKRYDNPWFPTLIAIKDGKEIARRSGYDKDAAAVKAWIDSVVTGNNPTSDPLVMNLKTEDDWNSMVAISKRHPVAIRPHLDWLLPYWSAPSGKIADTMVKGDGGKWTLAQVDLNMKGQNLLKAHNIQVQAVPEMMVFYNGSVRLTPLLGDVNEQQMRDWVNTMLSTHYPEN